MAVKGGGAMAVFVVWVVMVSFLLVVEAQGECSRSQPCPNSGNCCSKWGYCGQGNTYCGDGCQAGPCSGGGGPSPPGPTPSGGLGAILTRDLFEQFFPGHLPFYSYNALIEAANAFSQFGTTGDTNTRKREIAAYVAHVTHETSGSFEMTVSVAPPWRSNSEGNIADGTFFILFCFQG